MSRVLVTGALGNVGSAVIDSLPADVDVVAADVSPAAISKRLGNDLTAVHLDFTDPDSFGTALAGVSRVFLIRPPAISRVGPTLNRFIDTAAVQGVQHIVFSSVAGAESNRIVPHHRVERHLVESGIEWTMLRPGFFSQNIGSAYRQDIITENRINVPAGDGLVAFIDARDIGAVAALALTDPGHRGQEYHLTGPRAITFEQLAALMSDVLGRPIRYEPAGVVPYWKHLRQQQLPRIHALVQTVLHAGLRQGDAEPVTDTIELLLGRPARTIRDYLEDNVDLWTP